MNASTVREKLSRRPFLPIAITLDSGERHEIRHPELVIMTKSKVLITLREADCFAITSMRHITTIDTLQNA